MSNVPIPEDSLLEAVGALISAAFLWLLRLERRPKGLSREEYDKLCERDRFRLDAQFTEVKLMLTQQNERREELIRDVNSLKVTTAVLASQQSRNANRESH